MFRFKSSQAQALWWPLVFAGTDWSMERPLDRFCHRITNLNQLEGWQLWLYLSYRWPAHKNDALWASQGHHQYLRTSGSNYRRSGATSRPLGLHHQWLRSDFYVQILVFALLLPRYQKTTLHRIPPPNRRADGMTEQHNWGVPSSLCQLRTEQLGKILTNGRVCLQQC